jgi:hypothetical protein
MSWSIYKSGTPEEVITALEEQSNSIGGQSKEEYDEALPHLVALVKQNIGGVLNFSAYGHGIKNEDGSFSDKDCSVAINR